MNILVTFDSTFGNTAQIAQTIAGILEEYGPVRFTPVDQISILGLGGVDLWVLGCPTQRHSLTPAVRALVKSIPRQALRGLQVGVFDTRYHIPMWKSGSAARTLARKLRRLGGSLIVPAGSFFVVTREGPLENGELERAAEWAFSILERFRARLYPGARTDSMDDRRSSVDGPSHTV